MLIRLITLIICSVLILSFSFSSVNIIGGRHIESFKEQLDSINVIQFSTTKTNQSMNRCTGTLIDQKTLITAAHCLDDMSLPILQIQSSSMPSAISSIKHDTLVIKNIKMHPNYFALNYLYYLDHQQHNRLHHSENIDIAIVELVEEIQTLVPAFQKLKKIKIGSVDEFLQKSQQIKKLYTLGYGVESHFQNKRAANQRIKHCDLPIRYVDRSKAGRFSFLLSISDSVSWKGSYSEKRIRPSEENCSIAKGDSGAPLLYVANEELNLIGIASSINYDIQDKVIISNDMSIIEQDTLCWLDHYTPYTNLQTECHKNSIEDNAKKSPLMAAELVFLKDQERQQKKRLPPNRLVEFYSNQVNETLLIPINSKGNVDIDNDHFFNLGYAIHSCRFMMKNRLATKKHTFQNSVHSAAGSLDFGFAGQMDQMRPHNLFGLRCESAEDGSTVYIQLSLPLGFPSHEVIVEIFSDHFQRYQRLQMKQRIHSLLNES